MQWPLNVVSQVLLWAYLCQHEQPGSLQMVYNGNPKSFETEAAVSILAKSTMSIGRVPRKYLAPDTLFGSLCKIRVAELLLLFDSREVTVLEICNLCQCIYWGYTLEGSSESASTDYCSVNHLQTTSGCFVFCIWNGLLTFALVHFYCPVMAGNGEVNRVILQEEDRIKSETESAKIPVDYTTLQLHNLMYEKNHYLKAIKACKDFKSKYPDIELVPEEDFFRNAPEELKGDPSLKEDPHKRMLQRLNFELFQVISLSLSLSLSSHTFIFFVAAQSYIFLLVSAFMSVLASSMLLVDLKVLILPQCANAKLRQLWPEPVLDLQLKDATKSNACVASVL
eukprot:Gb_36956 [translate_table: standard]